jgi:pimeloyl-ACP methyl ester carboxylesterase
MIEKKVSFTSSGLKLSGVLHLPSKHSKSAVIFANGNPDSFLEHHAPIVAARTFCQNGFAALRFNPRGRPPSKGSYVTHDGVLNQASDTENAIKFMRKMGFKNIGLVGHSMGGAAVILADKKGVKAIVLWEPASIKTWKKHFLTKKILGEIRKKGYYLEKKYGMAFGKNFTGDIIKLKGGIGYRLSEFDACPVLFISGSDTLLAPEAKAYFQAAREPKSLKIIKGATHTFDAYDHEKLLLKYTVDWLKKYITR